MINLALIGLGKWGQNYLETVKNIPYVKIKYICSATSETLDKYSSEYLKTINYLDLLSKNDLNGVIIATPSATHYQITKAFLKRKIPVLVEKPLTLHYLEAKELVALSKHYQTMLMTGHIYLSHPAFIKLLQLIPKIGNIEYLEFEAGNFGPFRKDVSIIWDWLSHDLSMCLKILKKIPKVEFSWIQKNGNIFQSILKSDNTDIFIKINRKLPRKKRMLTVIGNKGVLIFDDTMEQKLILYNYQKNQIKKNYPKYKNIMPLKNQILKFIKIIKNRQYLTINVKLAQEVIRIITEIEKINS